MTAERLLDTVLDLLPEEMEATDTEWVELEAAAITGKGQGWEPYGLGGLIQDARGAPR